MPAPPRDLDFYKASTENLVRAKQELEARVKKLERENELLQDALDEVVGLRPKIKVLQRCFDIYHTALGALAWNSPLNKDIARSRSREALKEVEGLRRSTALERLRSLPPFPDSMLAASGFPEHEEAAAPSSDTVLVRANYDSYRKQAEWWDIVTSTSVDVPAALAPLLGSDVLSEIEVKAKDVAFLIAWCSQFSGWRGESGPCLYFLEDGEEAAGSK